MSLADRADALFRFLSVCASIGIVIYVCRPVYWALEDRWRESYTADDAAVAAEEAEELQEVAAPMALTAGEGAASSTPSEKRRPSSLTAVTLPAATGGEQKVAEPAASAQPAVAAQAAGDPVVKDPTPQQQPQQQPQQATIPGVSDTAAAASSAVAGGGSEGASAASATAAVSAASATAAASAAPPVAAAVAAAAGTAGTATGGEASTAGAEAAAGTQEFAKGVRPIIHEGRPLLELLKQQIWQQPPPGTAMPAREEFALRREMVDFRKKDNVVVVTFANFAFLDFVTTFVRHLTNFGANNVLIGAMDQKILEALFFLGVPVFDLESGMPEIDAGWGSTVFHKMGREKVTLVNVFLSLGVELFICDTDVIFLRNPLEYMARYPMADVLTSSDLMVPSVEDESLEIWDKAHSAYNIGILHFRPTDPTRRFAREWAELLQKDEKVWDQNGFNDIMRKKSIGPEVEGLNNHVFWAYDGSLKLGILPVSIFCSGHTFFVQRLYKTFGLQPYAMHATFQFAGTEGKRHRFRESKEFYDLPQYYEPDNGLLHFVSIIPQHLLTGGNHTLETHFELVNYQLKNMRQALAIAFILNRTLVMPELWCRFDRMWYPHPGVLPGTRTPQPFLAPLDHVIQVNKMMSTGKSALNVDEFGPPIDFREYSFLDNPRTPARVLTDKLVVELCDGNAVECQDGKVWTRADGAVAVSLKTLSSQNTIRRVLEPHLGKKLIQFSQIQDTFGGWDLQPTGDKFNKRIRKYTAIWCCVNSRPGHVYYDFFASEKPGWKPAPPRTPQEDHPPED